MMEIIVLLTSIQATRLSEETDEDADVVFEVDASLSETRRSSDKMNIRFKIDLETQPQIAKVSLSGLTTIQGEADEVERLIHVQERKPPKIFMKIYHRLYPTLYLLCCALKIPCPGPKLLVNTNIVEAQEVPQNVES